MDGFELKPISQTFEFLLIRGQNHGTNKTPLWYMQAQRTDERS